MATRALVTPPKAGAPEPRQGATGGCWRDSIGAHKPIEDSKMARPPPAPGAPARKRPGAQARFGAAPIGPLALARQRASAVRGFTGARTPVCEHPHGPTRVLAAPTRGVALTLSANIRCAGGFGAPRIFNTSLLKHAERPSTNGLSFAEGLPSATIYIRDISMPSGSLNTVVPSYARPQSRECSDIHRITALL